jgi:hypothetical protein
MKSFSNKNYNWILRYGIWEQRVSGLGVGLFIDGKCIVQKPTVKQTYEFEKESIDFLDRMDTDIKEQITSNTLNN